MRPPYRWQLRSRALELGARTLIMGILNVTPDSFSDGGAFLDPQRAIQHGLQLFDQGADIVDIGGESTRPGTTVSLDASCTKPSVTAEEELSRVMPVIDGIRRARPESILSIDTYKAHVAQAAVKAGVEIVNDVSAFEWDVNMASLCADLQCGVVLMHMRGKPTEWRNLAREIDISTRVVHDLANRAQIALDSGVEHRRIVLDPGFGFGKNFEENYPLLAHLDRLQRLGFPILTGTSRKSFVGRSVGRRRGREDAPPPRRLYGSIAAMVISILGGAHIVRAHDVESAAEAAAITDEVLAVG